MSAKKIVMISMLLSLHGPAFADAGNPAEGDKLFRNCQACHTLTGPNGEKLRTGGRVGPNLYGIVGRAAGGLEGYNFSPGLKALNTSGLIWTEEALTAFRLCLECGGNSLAAISEWFDLHLIRLRGQVSWARWVG